MDLFFLTSCQYYWPLRAKSVLQTTKSQESFLHHMPMRARSKNPLENRVLWTRQEIFTKIKHIMFCCIRSHWYIRGSEEADLVAEDTLSLVELWCFKLPCADLKKKIQPFTSSLWQERWNKELANKLYAIIPQVYEKYYLRCTKVDKC